MTGHPPRPITDDAPRLGVGIIGAGRVGAVLGAALRREGHAITGAYAVSDASRQRAEELLPGVPLLDVPRIVERSELIILAVPDDQLADLAAGIAAAGLSPGGQIVLHTSGRYGSAVLAPLEKAGCVTLAMHPAMTFSGTEADLPLLVGCPMALTARDDVLPIAQALAVELGGEPFILPEGDRPLYHAAMAHGANHLVVLVDQARSILTALGVDNPGAALRPLLTAALDGALRHGAAALTGPVRRGDAGTLRAHLEALADYDRTAALDRREDVEATYRALARAAVERAGLDEQARERILAVVDDAPEEHL